MQTRRKVRERGVKPILMLLASRKTIDDQKPLAILAVHAALAAKHLGLQNIKLTVDDAKPVTIGSDDRVGVWITSIQRFAEYLIGEDYADFLDIQVDRSIAHRDHYLEFSVDFYSSDTPRIPLDFGDSFGTNRFTSRILEHFRPQSTFFGSLFLPLVKNVYWSNVEVLHEFHSFVYKHKRLQNKILTIAGSLEPPFEIAEIMEWLELNPDPDWAIVLVGYKANKKRYKHENMLHIKHYIEYEDLVRDSDFFVSNCGAGSTIVPALAGCGQLCRIRGSLGSDKQANEKAVYNRFKMGPYDRHDDKQEDEMTFFDFMLDLENNLSTYTKNARIARSVIVSETKQQFKNLRNLFTMLLESSTFQSMLEKTKTIPREFALD